MPTQLPSGRWECAYCTDTHPSEAAATWCEDDCAREDRRRESVRRHYLYREEPA